MNNLNKHALPNITKRNHKKEAAASFLLAGNTQVICCNPKSLYLAVSHNMK